MSKETKEDRIVRNIFDQVSEHLHELKNLEANPNTKESDIERWAITVLKSCLGYSVTNGYSLTSQEQKGKMRPDVVVYKDNQPIFVVEVKKLGFDLSKSDFRCGKIQLQEYLYSLGKVQYGFLCNGYEWKLYDFNNSNGIIEIFSIDFRNDEDKIDVNKKFVSDLCYELINFHESTYQKKEWQSFTKEATAFSPESLARAVLSSNAIKIITKEIRGEHDYKAGTDILFEKVYDLLANGLDNSIKDFNEQKKIEFQKYIKTQQRLMKKSPKKVVKNNTNELTVDTTLCESEGSPVKTDSAA